jgi:hypothetical protein
MTWDVGMEQGFDVADNVLNDGQNQYPYDGDGRRVAESSITKWSCDPAVNGFTTTYPYVIVWRF